MTGALIETMSGLSEALVDACAAGEAGVVARLLNQHADPSIGASRSDGLALCVPLVEATLSQSALVVTMLVRNGAAVDQPDGRGLTALVAACTMDDEGIVTQLLRAHACVDKSGPTDTPHANLERRHM